MHLYNTGHSNTSDPEAVANMFTVVTQWYPLCERLIQNFLKLKFSIQIQFFSLKNTLYFNFKSVQQCVAPI